MARGAREAFEGVERWAEVWVQRLVLLMFWTVADLLTFPRVPLLEARVSWRAGTAQGSFKGANRQEPDVSRQLHNRSR